MADTPLVANRGAITACVILAVIMQALDTTIANVALPYIEGSVSASADQINWVLTSYIVAAAIMTPPSGFLSNRFGRRRMLLVAIAGFVVASMLCGFSESLGQIVAFRLLQGQDALADYQRTTPTQPTPFLHFYFCKTCGVRTFTYGPASERLGEAFHAVNLASLDDVTDEELAATPIHFADGRHNDWDHATGFRFL